MENNITINVPITFTSEEIAAINCELHAALNTWLANHRPELLKLPPMAFVDLHHTLFDMM